MRAEVTYDMIPFVRALISVAMVGISFLVILELVIKTKSRNFWLIYLLTGFNILVWTCVLR